MGVEKQWELTVSAKRTRAKRLMEEQKGRAQGEREEIKACEIETSH